MLSECGRKSGVAKVLWVFAVGVVDHIPASYMQWSSAPLAVHDRHGLLRSHFCFRLVHSEQALVGRFRFE